MKRRCCRFKTTCLVSRFSTKPTWWSGAKWLFFAWTCESVFMQPCHCFCCIWLSKHDQKCTLSNISLWCNDCKIGLIGVWRQSATNAMICMIIQLQRQWCRRWAKLSEFVSVVRFDWVLLAFACSFLHAAFGSLDERVERTVAFAHVIADGKVNSSRQLQAECVACCY